MQICVNMKEVAHGALYAKYTYIYIYKKNSSHPFSITASPALGGAGALSNCLGVKAE